MACPDVIRVQNDGTWKAVLTYTDAPGPVQEAWEQEQVLVNDLDLEPKCSQEANCDVGEEYSIKSTATFK